MTKNPREASELMSQGADSVLSQWRTPKATDPIKLLYRWLGRVKAGAETKPAPDATSPQLA